MSPSANKRPHGQLRVSQVITTFGPGAMVDLPRFSVMVQGLDEWKGDLTEIHEPRLAAKVGNILDLPSIRLKAPPIDSDDPTQPKTGINVIQFPEWYVTQDPIAPGERARYLIHRSALTGQSYVDDNRVKKSVVPVRFVRACRRGHVDDIDWYSFVHHGPSTCRRQLLIDERGTSGDISEMIVRCACGNERNLGDASLFGEMALGKCDGKRPWLGRYSNETCGHPSRLLVRTASNAYFPQILSVISLPDRDEELNSIVAELWENHLQYVTSMAELKRERARQNVELRLRDYSNEDILRQIDSRRTNKGAPQLKNIKVTEFETLFSCEDEVGVDEPDSTFYAKALPPAEWASPSLSSVARVVLVQRLREVLAQIGFTRFEAFSPGIEGELDLGVQPAALAREVTWVPAIENKGEGIFIAFKDSAINEWLKRPAVIARGKQLESGFNHWKEQHPQSKAVFAGLPYVMLHSLSHMLLSAIALECGYPASSIRERVYAGEFGYGVLLYTGSPDAEGTLGGIVEVGRRIKDFIATALEMGKLCSNDPVCAQHEPAVSHEERFLQGAACHGCLLIAETSCENRNNFLDRSLVVETVDSVGAEFFKGA